MEEDNLTNAPSDFGELFEGETAVFETTFSESDLGVDNNNDNNSSISGGGSLVGFTTSNLMSSSTSSHVIINPQQLNSSSSTSASLSLYRAVTQIQLPQQKQHLKRKVDLLQNQKSSSSTTHQVDGNVVKRMISNSTLSRQLSSSSLGHHQIEEERVDDEDSLMDGIGDLISYEQKDNVKEKVKLAKELDLVVRLRMNKYLKDEGYAETLLPQVVTKEMHSKMIDPSLSRTNSVLFGPSYRADEVQEEIERFFKLFLWVKERNPIMSNELKPMLMPLLVFFVRESYSNGFKPISNRLIGDLSRKILDADRTHENCLIAIAMSAMIKNGQGFEDKYLKEVCQRRHKFLVSEWTFATLKKFLSKLKRSLLVNILSQHFLIELTSSQEICNAVSANNGTSAETHPPALESSSSVVKPSRVKRVLDRLRGSVTANLPSIKVYTTNGVPSAAAMSREGSLFAFGMSTSGIWICAESCAKTVPFPNDDEDDDNEDDDDTTIYTPSIKTVNGHEGGVYGISFHPRTRLLYSVGQDSVMRAWDFTHDLANIGCKTLYRGHFGGPIWAMDMSSSGQLIGTASSDTTARIWVPERVECVRILAGHYFDVDSIKFHPNDTYVATGSSDKSARLWSVSDGEMVRIMTGADGKINALSFHQSGNYLVGGGLDDMIRVWDIRDGKLIAELPSLKNCKDLAFHGNMLAGCYSNGSVQVWNLRNIVGGDDLHLQEDFSVCTVPKPYTVQSEASLLLKVFYKTHGDLLCLGAHSSPDVEETAYVEETGIEGNSETTILTNNLPPLSEETLESITTDNVASMFINLTSSQTNDPLELSCDMEVTSPPPTSSSSNNIMNVPPMIVTLSEDIHNCLEEEEEDDAENTNNTITSSDMEFEVDEQILESFVDDALLQS